MPLAHIQAGTASAASGRARSWEAPPGARLEASIAGGGEGGLKSQTPLAEQR
jgi:hypothetical protein